MHCCTALRNSILVFNILYFSTLAVTLAYIARSASALANEYYYFIWIGRQYNNYRTIAKVNTPTLSAKKKNLAVAYCIFTSALFRNYRTKSVFPITYSK